MEAFRNVRMIDLILKYKNNAELLVSDLQAAKLLNPDAPVCHGPMLLDKGPIYVTCPIYIHVLYHAELT